MLTVTHRKLIISLAVFSCCAMTMGRDNLKPAENACQVYDYDAVSGGPHLTSYRWSGLCLDGLASGSGELDAFVDGKLDEATHGTMIKGKLEGYSATTFSDGSRFAGYYAGGKRHGKGEVTDARGGYYYGNFADGQRSGYGVLTAANGARYEGEWVNGLRSGKGTISWPSGARYQGQFLMGQRSGHGEWSRLDGTRYVGQWARGKFDGRGLLTFADGQRYEGRFADGGFMDGIWVQADGRRMPIVNGENGDMPLQHNGSVDFTATILPMAPKSDPP